MNGQNDPHGKNNSVHAGKVNTQVALARSLHNHYSSRIFIQIVPETLAQWRKGERLPSMQTPLPPTATAAGHWDVTEWITWFDKHLLSHYAITKGSGGNSTSLGDIERMRQQNEVDELLQKKKKRDIEDGKYVEKSILEKVCFGIGRTIRAEINRVEIVLPLALDGDLKDMGVPDELRLRIMERFRPRCQRYNEDLQTAIPTALRALGDDALLNQNQNEL